MRRYFFIVVLALMTISGHLNAQHWISAGLRGGAGTYLATGEIHNRLAPNFMADVTYSYLWPIEDIELGVLSGLSFGYTGGAYRATVDEQYRNTDYLDHPMDYHNTTSFARERIDGFTMEIPAMMALYWNGLVLNSGFKLQVPCWHRYRQQLKDPIVSATYPEYGVTVTNEVITGVVADSDLKKRGKRDMCDVSLLLGFELGYEWTLPERQDRIGLMGYLDGALCGHKAGARTKHVIDVAPITNAEDPVPEVKVNTIVGTYAKRMNYLDFGVKVYYRFDVLSVLPIKE